MFVRRLFKVAVPPRATSRMGDCRSPGCEEVTTRYPLIYQFRTRSSAKGMTILAHFDPYLTPLSAVHKSSIQQNLAHKDILPKLTMKLTSSLFALGLVAWTQCSPLERRAMICRFATQQCFRSSPSYWGYGCITLPQYPAGGRVDFECVKTVGVVGEDPSKYVNPATLLLDTVSSSKPLISTVKGFPVV